MVRSNIAIVNQHVVGSTTKVAEYAVDSVKVNLTRGCGMSRNDAHCIGDVGASTHHEVHEGSNTGLIVSDVNFSCFKNGKLDVGIHGSGDRTAVSHTMTFKDAVGVLLLGDGDDTSVEITSDVHS